MGRVSTPAPSPGVIGWWPCFQANTDTSVVDVSGKSRNLSFGAGLTTAEAWAAANAFSSVDTTADDCGILARSAFDWDFNAGENFLLSCLINAAAPAATRTLFGNGYNSTSAQGLRFIVKSTGVCAPWFYESTGDLFLADTSGALADSTTKHLMFAWYDHDVASGTARYMIWFNGVRQYAVGVSASGLGTINPVDDFRIGGNKTGASAFQSMAASFSALQMYRSARSVDWDLERLDRLAVRLRRSPATPLTENEWPTA